MPDKASDWTPASETVQWAGELMLSFPEDVTRLLQGWKTCTVANILGLLDPPHTLGRATAMVPVKSEAPMATPGGMATPATVAATPTPTPDTKSACVDVASPAILPTETRASGPSPQPDAGAESGSQGVPQSSPEPEFMRPNAEKATAASSPTVNDPPNTNGLPAKNFPPNDEPTKKSPINMEAPNAGPSNNNPSINDLSNDNPNLKNPIINDPAAARDHLANTNPSANNAPSTAMPSLGLSSTNLQSQSPHQGQYQYHDQDHDPPINPSTPSLLAAPSPNIAAHIASAFGYMPDVTATPLSAPASDPIPVGTIKLNAPTPLLNHIGDVMVNVVPQTLDAAAHAHSVNLVIFSHDGKHLASASDDKTVKIWDMTDGICLQTLGGHRGWVKSVVFSHDGKQLASASHDKTVKIWDAEYIVR